MSMAIFNSKTVSLPEETVEFPCRSPHLIGEVKELWGLGTSKGGSKPRFFSMGFPIKNLFDLRGNQQKYPEMMIKSFHRNWNMFFSTKIALLFENTFWANSIKFKHLYSSILSYIIYHPRQ